MRKAIYILLLLSILSIAANAQTCVATGTTKAGKFGMCNPDVLTNGNYIVLWDNTGEKLQKVITKADFIANYLGTGITAPTLNAVLTNGNTSLLDAKIGALWLYDVIGTGYEWKIYDSASDSSFNIEETSFGGKLTFDTNGYGFKIKNADNGTLKLYSTSTTNLIADYSGIAAGTKVPVFSVAGVAAGSDGDVPVEAISDLFVPLAGTTVGHDITGQLNFENTGMFLQGTGNISFEDTGGRIMDIYANSIDSHNNDSSEKFNITQDAGFFHYANDWISSFNVIAASWYDNATGFDQKIIPNPTPENFINLQFPKSATAETYVIPVTVNGELPDAYGNIEISSGGITGITAGDNIVVTPTDPDNPTVSLDSDVVIANSLNVTNASGQITVNNLIVNNNAVVTGDVKTAGVQLYDALNSVYDKRIFNADGSIFINNQADETEMQIDFGTGNIGWRSTDSGFYGAINGLASFTSNRIATLPNKSGTFAFLDDISSLSTTYFPLVGGSITGTSGAGFIGLITQSTAPSTPASGVRIYARSTGALSWKGTNGFERSFVGTGLTADRTYTLPDASVTLVGLDNVQALSNKDLTAGTNTFPTFNQNTTGSAATLTTPRTIGTLTGDATSPGSTFNGSANNTNAVTLATVNSNVGTFGSATQSGTFTVNAKGLITAASNLTVTPAVGSITGLGTGVATFLATPSSANLITAMTDETGTGALVFGTSPALTTPTATQYNFGSNSKILSATAGSANAAGRTLYAQPNLGSVADTGFLIRNATNLTQTSGTATELNIQDNFAPTSGTAELTSLGIFPTINQTGGANGITRGLYINPTLTAAADFRAIDAVTGGIKLPYRAVTTTSTLANTDYFVTATGTITITLPSPVAGKVIKMKNIGTGTITILPGSGNIDGVSSKTNNTQYSGSEYTGDGTNWLISGAF